MFAELAPAKRHRETNTLNSAVKLDHIMEREGVSIGRGVFREGGALGPLSNKN